MAHAVVFLGGAGEFVFFDDAAVVFGNTRDGYETRLGVTAHHLTVEVHARLRVLRERALLPQQSKVFRAFGVHSIRIHVDGGIEVDFRFADVQKTKRVVLRKNASFVAVHHVIRKFTNFCG